MFYDGQSLANIASLSKRLYRLTNEYWKFSFFRDFRALDLGYSFNNSSGMLLYRSARLHASPLQFFSCQVLHLVTYFALVVFINAENYRASVILIESKNAHLVMMSEEKRDGSFYAVEVENVKEGLWIVGNVHNLHFIVIFFKLHCVAK